MSISYEEALATLQAMFGETWTQDGLDTVLRHFKGHMENTVECLLGHGDKPPQQLLVKLKNGTESASANTAMDEQLAQQLSQRGGSATAAPSSSTPTPAPTNNAGSSYMSNYRPRGTPTTLPDDFLRLQNQSGNASTGGIGGSNVGAQSTMDSDEALARMLQDQLFSDELRRNPDFAHLAGRPRVTNNNTRSNATRSSGQAARTFAAQPQQQPPSMANMMEKLSLMGTSAKFKLAQSLEQLKNNTNQLAAKVGGNAAAGGGVARSGQDNYSGNSLSPHNETKGLLDDDDGALEMGSRKDL